MPPTVDTSFFRADAATCVRCGACVRDCAFKALKSSADGSPVMAEPTRCMRCQHCLAVCPTGAVSLDGRTAAACLPAAGAELPSAAAVTNWMHLRRSIRQFARKDVDPATLDSVLRTLGSTPTGCNARGLTFTCFRTGESMDRLRREFLTIVAEPRAKMLPRWLAIPAIQLRKGGADQFFRGATGLLVVSSNTDDPAVATPREDVTIACSCFEYLANAHGIGTCWCGFLNMIEGEIPGLVERLAGIPQRHPFAAILFGIPAIRYARGVARDDYARIVYRD